MAAQYGFNTLEAGQSIGWVFTKPKVNGFLPILSVMPLNPAFTDPSGIWDLQESLDSVSFPSWNQLGIATIWTQLSIDQTTLYYYLIVMNFSPSTISYRVNRAESRLVKKH
jgi:hypothetical protein